MSREFQDEESDVARVFGGYYTVWKIFLSAFVGGVLGGIATDFIGLWSLPIYYVVAYYFFRKLEVVSRSYSPFRLAGVTFLIVTLWTFIWPVVVLGMIVFGSRDLYHEFTE